MMMNIKYLAPLVFLFACNTVKTKVTKTDTTGSEPYRPQVHFTPQAHWMNDPNGMVFYNNQYHLFYQYYPDSSVWGPMHWAHATSTDLIHWQHKPTAIYPDSLGYIFSGSAVVDANNTSGLGINGKPPLVAIYTSHDPVGEKAGSATFQNQSMAYSLNDGETWIKYRENPVLKNPGVRDFRDPKISWYEATKKWIMTLATQDRITFFSSPDLKTWHKESEFGKTIGAHGGVWECPDLFPLDYNGKQMFVLLASINPGGPNKGSATQYFIGDFNGNSFTPADTITRWIDYGPDDYAGITWSNTGNRKIFIGWMSNWLYANKVPTEKWRGATTIPRDLSIRKEGAGYLLASVPVPELKNLAGKAIQINAFAANGYNLTSKISNAGEPAKWTINTDRLADFMLTFFNDSGEKLVVGFNKAANEYFIDRSNAGQSNFNKDFAAIHTAPRLSKTSFPSLTLVMDQASVELFGDDGLTVMTAIFFPKKPFTKASITAADGLIIKQLEFTPLTSIYR